MSSEFEESGVCGKQHPVVEPGLVDAKGCSSDPPEVQESLEVEGLRASWQFAATLHFCRTFSQPMRLRSFPAETLENALVHPYSSQRFLAELFFNLLRQDASQPQPFNERDADQWEHLLHQRMAKHWSPMFEDNPLASLSFFEVPPSVRVSEHCGEWPIQPQTVAMICCVSAGGGGHSPAPIVVGLVSEMMDGIFILGLATLKTLNRLPLRRWEVVSKGGGVCVGLACEIDGIFRPG